MAVMLQQITFKGQKAQLLKKVLLYLIVTEALLSILLMGVNGSYVFAVFLIVSVPVVLVYFIAMTYLDRFTFNDQKNVITRPLRRGVPYKKIKAIYLMQENGTLKIRVKRWWLWRTTLVRTLDMCERDRLREEIGKRFSEGMVQQKKVSDWRNLLIIIALCTVIGFAYHTYFYYHYPNLRIAPKQIELQNTFTPEKHEKTYELKIFTFTLPKTFKEETKESDDRLLFSDKKAGLLARVIYKPEKEKMPGKEILFVYGTGMRDYFDLLWVAYPAQFGVIPLMLKKTVLGDLANIEIYTFKRASLTGFIMRGKTDKQRITHILLRDSRQKTKINFFLASQKDISMDTVKRIADSIQTIK